MTHKKKAEKAPELSAEKTAETQKTSVELIIPISQNNLSIKTAPISEIPKTTRRHSGNYAEVVKALENCPEGQAVIFDVPTRPTAAGYQKYFKDYKDPITQKSVDVVTRAVKEGDKVVIRVYVGKGLKTD
jgi:hypothetical protein